MKRNKILWDEEENLEAALVVVIEQEENLEAVAVVVVVVVEEVMVIGIQLDIAHPTLYRIIVRLVVV